MAEYTPSAHVARERYWLATVNDPNFPGADGYANDKRAETFAAMSDPTPDDAPALSAVARARAVPDSAGLRERLAENWRVFKKHSPAGAYLPVGQMDGDCRECGGAWPCAAVLAVVGPTVTAEQAWDQGYASGEERTQMWDPPQGNPYRTTPSTTTEGAGA